MRAFESADLSQFLKYEKYVFIGLSSIAFCFMLHLYVFLCLGLMNYWAELLVRYCALLYHLNVLPVSYIINYSCICKIN